MTGLETGFENGLMMDAPLTLAPLLERAARLFPAKEIASKTDAGMHRYTYADFHKRVHRIAWTLQSMGVQPGDRVGTLCWNGYRHLELYFAVTCYGAVLHTLNLRLAADQLAYIIDHAGDKIILCDASLAIFAQEPRTSTGHQWIDEEALTELAGITNFDRYWCEGKPPANPIYIDKW